MLGRHEPCSELEDRIRSDLGRSPRAFHSPVAFQRHGTLLSAAHRVQCGADVKCTLVKAIEDQRDGRAPAARRWSLSVAPAAGCRPAELTPRATPSTLAVSAARRADG